ncbi:histone-lysine N-methyltransferase SETMAR [Trichonephila clavipes]|nr:histone-lysine N-methyltransferase SETMAR [Trichonephila clavipes]
MEVNKERIRFILQFFFDKGENTKQVVEIANGVYGADTVTANYVQFWFHRFRSGIFDVKDASRTGRPIVENVDKITELIEVDRHELLPHGQTLNSDLYCQQLDRFKLANARIGQQKRFCVPSDNARPHTSVMSRQKLWELGLEVLRHPPHRPDLAPSHYHLFLALQNFLSDKKLGSREDGKNRLLEFFANKGQDFYERVIMKLHLK